MFVKFQGNEDPELTVRILKNWTLSFSRPSELNDPFESSPEHYELSRKEFDRHIESRCGKAIRNSALVHTGRHLSKWSTEYRQRVQFIANSIRGINGKQEQDAESVVQEKVNMFGVFCVSNIPSVLGTDASLMWAHYAKDHSGVAIALNPRHRIFWSGEWPPEERGEHFYMSGADSDGFHPVKYTKSRPKVPVNIDGQPDAMRALLNKSSVWRYENEWRCIKLIRDNGNTRTVSDKGRRLLLKGDATLVSDVFIGARASNQTKDAVFNALRQPDANHIVVHELKLSRKRYELEILDRYRLRSSDFVPSRSESI